MSNPDREALPMITRGEQRAIERLFAGSFAMMDALRGFVRNRAVIHADEPFTTPLERLFAMAEDALERVGFWPEDYDIAEDQAGSFRREPVDITQGPLVIIESPFAGEVDKNVAYARQAVRDSLLRGEHPIASHLLYTQPGILNDDVPEERKRGIDAGLAWRRAAQKAVFYVGCGWSIGMLAAKEVYDAEGFPYEVRDMPAVREPGRYAASGGFPLSKRARRRHAAPVRAPAADDGLFDGERIVSSSELENRHG